MQNPLESEEAAFRFVLGAIVYFAPIVVAAWIATWLGVIVFVVMSALAVVVLRRGTASVPRPVSTGRAAVDDTRLILVLTDSAFVGPRLRDALVGLAEDVAADVLLICAVAPSPGPGGATDAAGSPTPEQLEAAVGGIRAAGVNARGALALADAQQALEGALRDFAADEVVISLTSAEPAAAEAIAGTARSWFGGPVTVIAEDRLV